jgi:small subunit ribosomal protein S9
LTDDETPETPARSDSQGDSETQQAAATPEASATPETGAADTGQAAAAEQPASAESRADAGQTSPQEAAAEPPAEHAVPTEEAKEIAGVVEDAALEALQESAEQPKPAASEEPQPASAGQPEQESVQQAAQAQPEEEPEDEPKPREKPAVPGAHLEVDIVPEGVDPLGRDREPEDPYTAVAEVYEQEVAEGEPAADAEQVPGDEALSEPISTAAIDLASGARYRATGKRKTAIARVTLKPGDGSYLVNGRALEEHFPRVTLQRNIRQPLETVGYQERMDVIARLHGGGISAQAGALRHGVSRALLEADPNLRGELKRRGFLTRDSRAKERKKAGLKKARKRPQFSKR